MENRTTVEPNVEQAMEYICQHDYTNKAKEIVIKCVEAVVRNYYENPDDSRNEECFNVFLNILGFDIAECDFPKKAIVPVGAAVTRYYRTYVECYDGEDKASIYQKAIQQIVEHQDAVLTLDPCLDIEENDVNCLHIDFDGISED